MRTIVMSILALAIYFVNLMAAPAPTDPKPVQPTAKQLADAKEAYAKFGAKYGTTKNPKTEQTFHSFFMPNTTTDADLKGLPDPPFSFGLDLISTKVTDAGLKELKELKELTSLNLLFTQVTDAGLKELKELKELQQLTVLYLARTKVTDAGVKELKEALPKCQIIK
jgi:hypothetical protein